MRDNGVVEEGAQGWVHQIQSVREDVTEAAEGRLEIDTVI